MTFMNIDLDKISKAMGHEKAEIVKRLNTTCFNDTIKMYKDAILNFEKIVEDVNIICEKVVNHWKGKGRDAFNHDYQQVQINLKDVTDIMYEIRDVLIQAHAEYMKADEALAKRFES